MSQYRFVEICAGAGGQSLGLELAGFEHELSVELDPSACGTLRHNRPHWKVAEGDVASLSVWNPAEYAGTDLLAGGVPCPPFTVAGKQLGATDERDLFAWSVELCGVVRPRALLRIPPRDVRTIFTCSAHGAQRVDMLFRLAQRRVISRTVVATVAQQEDYMKRVRRAGGARSRLRPEGIVIFGHYDSHRGVAEQLRVPVPAPGSGESVSVRLARRRPQHDGLPFVTLDGERWAVALPGDPAELAPLLPDTKT